MQFNFRSFQTEFESTCRKLEICQELNTDYWVPTLGYDPSYGHCGYPKGLQDYFKETQNVIFTSELCIYWVGGGENFLIERGSGEESQLQRIQAKGNSNTRALVRSGN